MTDRSASNIRTIAIIGGGTAGWMSAAYLSKLLPHSYEIRLVESDDIGTIGVGEATVPAIKKFNQIIGIHEVDFIKATRATFKLGIEFVNWGDKGNRYFHDFRGPSAVPGTLELYQHWLKLKSKKRPVSTLAAYSINTRAALQNKFLPTQIDMKDSPLSEINYAYHFDAGLYAQLLRSESERRGVKRIEGKITRTELRAADGFLDSVVLESGEEIKADLFIDCSGLKALLIGEALGCPFEDWSQWLLCDRALAVPCDSTAELLPYTRSIAHDAGWQWRIPLQNRVGNGHVYSSHFMSDDEAHAVLAKNLDGQALADARPIKFSPGKRKRAWHKNCVAIGLAGGFLEPLESTSILLIQTGLQRLMDLFPDQRFVSATTDEYNRQTDLEYDGIRDFIIAHYKLTLHENTPFWRHCKHMEVPASLAHKIDLFHTSGRFFESAEAFFPQSSWVQVLLGQGLVVEAYDPRADLYDDNKMLTHIEGIRKVVQQCADIMPKHAEYIAQHCAYH